MASNLKDMERLLLHDVMFAAGIVPIEDVNHDVRRALQALPPDEARKLKRKFRKLWRKAAAELEAKVKSKNTSRAGCGDKEKKPSRAEKVQRKRLIYAQALNVAQARFAKMLESLNQKLPLDDTPSQGKPARVSSLCHTAGSPKEPALYLEKVSRTQGGCTVTHDRDNELIRHAGTHRRSPVPFKASR